MSEITQSTLHRKHVFLFVFISVIVLSIVFSAITLLIIHPPKKVKEDFYGRNNVLFIVIDDLRPILKCYGDEAALTPNIDRLASSSIIFKKAYAQQALGTPSRISFLTSRRPDSLHLYDSNSYWQDLVRNIVTLPEHVKNHGFETVSIGKVFPEGASSGDDYYNKSWILPPYLPPSAEYETKPVCGVAGQLQRNLICPVDVETQPGSTLPDIESTEYAIEFLKNKSQNMESPIPFFLAVGYHKPHIPFRIPKKYFDLYENIDMAPNHTQTRFPKVSYNPYMDIREYDDFKSLNLSMFDPVPESFQKLIRQGYYASVSYIDDQVGRLLEALESTGFARHTTIVLLGDHGWSLGEHKEWSKYSNFEVALQVPLIVHVPRLTAGKERKPFTRSSLVDSISSKDESIRSVPSKIHYPQIYPKYVSDDFVELVDIFPTIAEILKIAIPPICDLVTSHFCSEGNSFLPIIVHKVYDPEPWIPFSWKTAAFSQYPRPSLAPSKNSDHPFLEDIKIMGYSMRTEYYRYTEWVAFDIKEFKPDWALVISRELYSHVNDSAETQNLCDEEEYANTVIALSQRLKKGWREEMPPGFDEF